MSELITSTIPSFSEFDPTIIPFQGNVIDLVKNKVDYSLGIHEVLCSGSVGSAKSLLAAHLGIDHCLGFRKARLLLGRLAMPDLKSTIFQTILEHLDGTILDNGEELKEGKHYFVTETKAYIKFCNGSEIISRSWSDKKYKSKFRSIQVSAAIIEELTENDSDMCEGFHTEMIGRIGRLTHIPIHWVLYLTNPDDPTHWAYDYFIRGSKTSATRHVEYSLTIDNPFLPDWYISKLRDTYDAKMAKRLLEGQWLSIKTDVVYYEYDSDTHYVLEDTGINTRYPLDISFDFNIGEGKPMSSCLGQYNPRAKMFTFIDEVILSGFRTLDVMDEYASRGYFDLPSNPVIKIYGDASGKNKDTRNIKSDYDLIQEFLENYEREDKQEVPYQMCVPLANPAIKKRHNLVNGRLKNANKKVSVQIDKRCVKLDEGLRKVKLVVGGKFVEDDSKDYQHITTAFGYYIVSRHIEGEGASSVRGG